MIVSASRPKSQRYGWAGIKYRAAQLLIRLANYVDGRCGYVTSIKVKEAVSLFDDNRKIYAGVQPHSEIEFESVGLSFKQIHIQTNTDGQVVMHMDLATLQLTQQMKGRVPAQGGLQ